MITLFLPLSGNHWPEDFLNKQTWPRNQTRLILLDTSHDPEFSRTVRGYLTNCNYTDYHYAHFRVGPPEPTLEQHLDARNRVYARANLTTTEFVWLLSDDVSPPVNAVTTLLQAFTPDTVSVSAVYRNRDGYAYWSQKSPVGSGTEVVDGHGLGCCLVRRSFLLRCPFVKNDPAHTLFCYKQFNEVAKISWNCPADHDGIRHDFDEEMYLELNPDVKDGLVKGDFTTGLEHFLKHGQYENRPFKR